MASQELPKPPARRGRPRRKGGPSRTVVPTLLSPISRTDQVQYQATHDPTDVRPREERSYKEFFPDLDLATPLSIVRTHAPENDALLASQTILNTLEPTQKEVSSNDQVDDNGDSNESRLTRSHDKLPNGNKQSIATSEPTSTGMFGAISRTLNFARNQLAKKENGNFSVQESSPDFEESDLSSVGDSAATSSEEATSTPKSIQKHDQQESINMSSQAGDSNPYQALSTRPMHGSADINLTSAPTQQITLNLPKPSFWKIQEPKIKKSRAEKLQNDSDTPDADETFKRPENHYIRYIEPTEIDLFETVEYDMDEQGKNIEAFPAELLMVQNPKLLNFAYLHVPLDEAWLRLLNAERKKEGLGSLSTDLFENMMDQIEKLWFDLIKNLPKQSADEPALDSECAICDDGECENSNAIVFCDGCNLAVHQDCYGIPYIPEGQWLCRKCMVSPEFPVSCLFCPNEGGAFKQTNTNKWAHLLCAIWIPEVGVSNSVYMEPVDNIENIPKSRWKLSCYVCRQRTGACIQCDNKHCFTAFHVTCARKAKLYMKMKSHNPHYDGGMLRAYCDKHTPRDYKEQVNVHRALAAAQRSFGARSNITVYTPADSEDEDDYLPSSDEDVTVGKKYKKKSEGQRERKSKTRDHSVQSMNQLSRSSKAARAHQHQYTSGAPIAPEYIIDKLENLKALRSANHLRRKSQLVISVCRYWSLKRESRRGAPLLKRLHLEPWTASSSQNKQTEVEKARRAAAMMSLRADLERVRMLSEQVQKRERHKLERLRKQKAYLEIILFPLEYILKPILEELMEFDRKDFFATPVTDEIAPDYRDVIKEPMAFSTMIEKLTSHSYSSVEEFEADVKLICRNSMTYNKADTPYFKVAQKMETYSQPIIEQAKQDYASMKISANTGILDVQLHPEIFTYNLLKIPTAEEQAAEEEEKRKKAEEEEIARLAKEKKEAEETSAREKQEQKKAAALARAAAARQPHANKRTTRSMQSDSVPFDTVKPGRKLSHEAKKLLQTRAIESHPVEPPSPSKKVQRGFYYETESSDEEVSAPETKVKTNVKKEPEPRRLRSRPEQEQPPTPKPTTHKPPQQKEQPKRKARTPDSIGPQETSAPKKKAKIEKVDGDLLEDGRVVWARVIGFPAHPAKIVDHTKHDVEKHIMDSRPDPSRVLVQFYEVNEKHQWGWIFPQEISALGDVENDAEKLLLAKRTKKPTRIIEVRRGYLHACQVIDFDGQAVISKVFGEKRGRGRLPY